MGLTAVGLEVRLTVAHISDFSTVGFDNIKCSEEFLSYPDFVPFFVASF